MAWTTEQATALAPDAKSLTAGRTLAEPAKWRTLGRDALRVWGTYKGSAREPYQTHADFGTPSPAYGCTCPSRKQPCKHVLALGFMLADGALAPNEHEPPEWVRGWLQKRAQKPKSAPKKKRVADPAAQARRAAAREAKVAAGVEELDLWLRDLVRGGLAALQTESYSFWDGIAARMVDAQASGLAGRLRSMASIPQQGSKWPYAMAEALGQLYLLLEAYKRIDTLPPDLQAEVRAQIGWTQEKKDLLARPGVRDDWAVVGRFTEPTADPKLRAQRTWLWGQSRRQNVLILDFAYGDRAFGADLPALHTIDAELVFYDGAYSMRALIKKQHGPPTPLSPEAKAALGHATIAAAIERYTTALASNPWIERFPLTLRAVRPVPYSNTWVLRDAEGSRLHLIPRYERRWHMVAFSGGHPIGVFGEWDGARLHPLGMWEGSI